MCRFWYLLFFIKKFRSDTEIIIIADTKTIDKSLEICYEDEKLDNKITVIKQEQERTGANKNILKIALSCDKYNKKCLEIIQNKKLREDLSKKSREFIINNISWQKIGDKFSKNTSEVINDKV